MLRRFKWCATLACLILLAVPETRAQDSYWNPALASGNWDTTTSIWGRKAGGPYTHTWTNGDNAHLDSTVSGGSTATLTAAITTANIYFSGQFTVAASGGSLTTSAAPFIANTGSGTGQVLAINTQLLGATSPTFASFNGATATVALNANNTFSGGATVFNNVRLTIGNAATESAGTLTGNVSLSGTSAVISFESTQTYSGVVSGSGRLDVVSPASGSTTLTLTNAQTLTGPVNIFEGSTLVLNNNGTGTSGSISNANRISLDSKATLDLTDHTTGTWTLGNGQTLASAGSGSDGGQISGGNVRIQGTVSPGGASTSGSTGTLQVDGGVFKLAGGSTAGTRSTYDWSVNNWTGTTAGTHYSQLTGVAGADLDLTEASSTERIRLLIRSDNLTNFNSSVAGSWVIADFSAGNASGGVIGFSADKFLIDTSAFAPSLDGGTFSLSTDSNSNQIILSFQPVPEPAWILTLASGSVLAGGLIRRKFRPAPVQAV